MHPIVHAYAAGKLSRQPGRPEELRERHAHHYAARMREESPRIHQPDSAEALRRIEEALPNLLMAWDHSAESWPAGDGRIFLVVLSALFIARSTLSIARRVFSEKIGTYTRRWGADPSPDQASLLSNLLERIATFQNLAGLLDETRPVLRQALELAEKADDPELLPRLLGTLGVLEAQTNNTDEARKCFLRMLEKFEEIGDRSQMCVALSNLATLEFLEGNYEEAFGFYGRSLEISREQGDLINQMRALGSLGFMLIRAGDCERAQACLGESLGIARSLGDRRSEELALLGLADILKDADPSRAEELAGECIDLAESIEHVSMQVHAHLVLAGILIRLGRRTEARAALDTATALSGGDFDSQSEMRVEELERMLSDAGT
jgi:tetratricopeptide (TPR) repeat protein